MCENVEECRLSRAAAAIVSERSCQSSGEHVRRSHESQQLAGLDDTIDIAEDGLWLLRLSVLDRDRDALPPEAADVGVGELGVVTADHLLNVRHLGV